MSVSSNIAPLQPEGAAPLAPPANTEIEQALLGAILVNNAAHGGVADFLLPEHFANAVHGRIYAAIGKLVERGQIANPVTLKNLFDQDGALAEIGGAQYIARLAEAAVTIVNAEHYGRTIRDLYLRRELITIGQDVIEGAFRHDLDDPAAEQIERAEEKLGRLAAYGEAESGLRPFAAAWNELAAEAERAHRDQGVAGLSTGFADLDRLLGGLYRTDLIILAGRPSMGKTALATNIALNAALARLDAQRRGAPASARLPGAAVAFFSLEMSDTQLAARIGGEISGIASDRVRRGALDGDQLGRFLGAGARLAGLPLYIDQSGMLGVAQIRSRSRRLGRRLAKEGGLGLVVVDYLQLLLSRARGANRVEEVGEITRSLKALAKDLEMPVLACAQLSREVERREDKRPLLSDLRESGSIEQDADVVMMIYREEYYLARSEPAPRGDEASDRFEVRWQRWRDRLAAVRNTAELIVAKQRHGPIGAVKLSFEPEATRFGDLFEGGKDVR